jgi:hypothetical protein
MAKKIIGTVANNSQPIGTLSSKDKKSLSKAIKEQLEKERQRPKPITREDFASDEEWNAFFIFTQPLPLTKRVTVPFRTLGQYLKEYNLIMQKESSLNATQRILVKNVIHAEVRKRNIVLIKG